MVKVIFFDFWNTLFYKKQPFISALADRLGVAKDDIFERRVEEACEMAPCSDIAQTTLAVLARLNIEPTDANRVAVGRVLLNDWLPEPFPNTLMTIKKFRDQGFHLGIISNAFSPSFIEARKLFSLDELFEVIITSYDTGFLKPDPRIFQVALERANFLAEEALMVGDSLINDVEAALACGMRAVLLDYRNKYPSYHQRITDIADLGPWIELNSKN